MFRWLRERLALWLAPWIAQKPEPPPATLTYWPPHVHPVPTNGPGSRVVYRRYEETG